MGQTETTSGSFSAQPVAAVMEGLSARWQIAFATVVLLACLVPAMVNGYPIVFPDTEGYVVAADVFRPQFFRAFGYGAFLRVTGGLWSLWLPIIAQSALTAWLVTRAVALDSPRWRSAWRLPAALSLLVVVLLSHAPWLASWAQPDLFTGLMLLALLMLVEHRDDLSWVEQSLLLGLAIGGATTHLSHPPLLLGLAGVGFAALLLAKLRRAGEDMLRRARRTAVLALVAAGAGWGALCLGNLITYHKFTASLSGSVFLFSRLAGDGDVASALRPECEAGRPWAACRHLDRFKLTPEEFLWRGWSPLPDLGYATGFVREAAEINPILVRRFWPEWLAKSAGRTLDQLVHFKLGDGMDDEGVWMLGDPLVGAGQAKIAEAAEQTLQANDGLRTFMPRAAAEALSALGLVALVGFTVFGLVRGRPDLWWPALMFLSAYLGNAALVSLGSDVFARYSGRLVWLAPLVAGLLVLRAAGDRFRGARRPRALARA